MHFAQFNVNKQLNVLNIQTSTGFILVSVLFYHLNLGQWHIRSSRCSDEERFEVDQKPSSDSAVGNQIRISTLTQFFFAVLFFHDHFCSHDKQRTVSLLNSVCHKACLKKLGERDNSRQQRIALIRTPAEERQAAIDIGEERVSRESLVERKVRPERDNSVWVTQLLKHLLVTEAEHKQQIVRIPTASVHCFWVKPGLFVFDKRFSTANRSPVNV